MTTERFDIEVQDKVAKSIRTEILGIGSAAKSTHTSLAAMKREMAGMSGTRGASTAAADLRAAASAANENARAQRASVAAIQSVTDAYQAQARAAREAASARGAAGTAPARGASPLPSRASSGAGAGAGAAVAGLAGAKQATTELREYGAAAGMARHHSINLAFQMQDLSMQMAMAAQSSRPLSMGLMALFQQGTQIQGIAMQSGQSYKALGAELLTMMGILKKVTNAEAAQALAMASSEAAAISARAGQAAAAVAAAEVETALAVAQQRLAVTATEAAAAQTRLAAADQAVATAAAEAAIATNAQSASNARLGTASADASAKTITSITRFGRGGLIGLAALATGFVALKATQSEFNEDTKKSELTKGLGLTAKEMKKLEDVTITSGDVMKGVFRSLAQNMPQPIKDAYNAIKDAAGDAWDWSVQTAKKAINFMIGGMVAAYNIIVQTWDKFPSAIAELFFNAVNAGIEAINGLIKASVDGINSFISTAEQAIGMDLFGELSAPQIDKVKNNYVGATKQIVDAIKTETAAAMGTDYLGNAYDSVLGNAKDAARERLAEQAKAIKEDRAEKAGAKPRKAKGGKSEEEKRAEAMASLNRELDSQIYLLGFYGQALERESKFQAINNSLKEKGITLSAAEEKAIRNKIALIQEGTRIQAALNKLEEEVNGPQREYADTMAAITIALKDNIIMEDEALRRRNLAANKLAKDSNPLYDYVKEIARAEHNMGKYGRELAIATRAQELFDAAVAAGRDTDTGAGYRKGEYMDQARKEQKQGDFNQVMDEIDPRNKGVQDTNSFILDNYAEMYASIEEMRQNDLIGEEEANERKKNLDMALGSARLEVMSGIFGQLASLQNSKNREVAAIGKAAAITQATIDGIVAVQAALKGPPGPPWSYAIAAATGVTAAANVARIMGIGFETGGYTGNGGTKEVAGMVHGQEYVMDASATRRIGVPALEAMRKGSPLTGGPANDNRGGKGVTVKQFPGVAVEVRERPDGEIEIIAERAVRRMAPQVVAQDMMRDPNSKTSKAVSTAFGMKRQRG